MQEWLCRWSPTLGELEDSHQKIWGTKNYENTEDPTVFFGIYGLPDFYALWRHKGRKCILWAGSDITHFRNGYWLDQKGLIKIPPKRLAQWINTYCESYVENAVEYDALKELGIEAKVIPSFLGDVNQFPISYTPGNKLYTSVSGDNFELYGWDRIPWLATENPKIEFHLYGNTKRPFDQIPKNVILHGRVPKEIMNAEIAQMQGALRLTSFDGFSEILAKSILMGQWPVSFIEYPHILPLNEISLTLNKTEPNYKGREYYLETLNKYPWNQKK